jgi:hypothetical protein
VSRHEQQEDERAQLRLAVGSKYGEPASVREKETIEKSSRLLPKSPFGMPNDEPPTVSQFERTRPGFSLPKSNTYREPDWESTLLSLPQRTITNMLDAITNITWALSSPRPLSTGIPANTDTHAPLARELGDRMPSDARR